MLVTILNASGGAVNQLTLPGPVDTHTSTGAQSVKSMASRQKVPGSIPAQAAPFSSGKGHDGVRHAETEVMAPSLCPFVVLSENC